MLVRLRKFPRRITYEFSTMLSAGLASLNSEDNTNVMRGWYHNQGDSCEHDSVVAVAWKVKVCTDPHLWNDMNCALRVPHDCCVLEMFGD